MNRLIIKRAGAALGRCLILLAVVLVWTGGSAQAGTVTAELSRTEGNLDEAFLLTVTIEGSAEEEPTLPEVDGLVMREQGRSQQYSIANGRASSELHLTYAIYPQKAGSFTIPSMAIVIDGKKETTLPLTLKVTPVGTAPQAGSGGGGSGKPSAKSPATASDTGGVFIERDCGQAMPFVGEQVVCMIRVYHRGNLKDGQRVSQTTADLRRFNVEGEKRYQRLVDGKPYGVIELREVMVASKAGPIEIPPYTLNAHVMVRSRRGGSMDKFFDNFGGGMFNFDMNFMDVKEVQLSSGATPLTVKPLPEEGRPPEFRGVVGSYELSANVSTNQVKTGDTVTVTIMLQGLGVLDDIAAIKPQILDTIGKVYDDKPEYKEEIDGDAGIRSARTFKYALVPNKEGSFDLGSIEVPIFDPATQQYQVLKATLGQLIVEPGKAEAAPLVVGAPAAGTEQQDVKVIGKDVIGPHPISLASSKQTITKSNIIVFGAVSSTPLILGFALLGFRTFQDRRDRNPSGERRSRALRRFRTAVAEADVLLGQAKPTEALAKAHLALRAYLGDKLDIHGPALTAKEIDAHLQRLGMPDSQRSAAASTLAQLERAEFGGWTPDADAARAVVARVGELSEEVDRLC